jgi:NIMA (never in mitosis gene a)-related kinase
MQIVQALNYMHIKKGVVHRDLSPSNILLEHGSQRVKLADFGLAKAHNGDWSKRRRDELVMQSAVGTIAFSSPEIIMHEPYGDKVDVWSLGCILYYMLALHPPFEGPNPLVIASAIVEGRYGQAQPWLLVLKEDIILRLLLALSDGFSP